MTKEATLTSKGQITIPVEVRRLLRVKAGDRLRFTAGPDGVQVVPVRPVSPFAKYQGIGNPGLKSGRKAVVRFVRELRGE
jgi:AbrB family looped-hinge helix DNA binding protein